MSNPNQQIDISYDHGKIVRERVLWAGRPIIAAILLMWCILPSTTRPEIVDHNTLVGFMFGIVYGLFVFRSRFLNYIIIRRRETIKRKNRFPDEYYFGKVKEVMQLDGESMK